MLKELTPQEVSLLQIAFDKALTQSFMFITSDSEGRISMGANGESNVELLGLIAVAYQLQSDKVTSGFSNYDSVEGLK